MAFGSSLEAAGQEANLHAYAAVDVDEGKRPIGDWGGEVTAFRQCFHGRGRLERAHPGAPSRTHAQERCCR